MQVEVRNGRVDKALSVLRKKCGDILHEIRERQHYEKPSDKKRTALKCAKIREQKRQKEA